MKTKTSFMHTLRVVLLVALSASGTVSAHLLDREALLAARQSPGQDENRISGSCVHKSNKCNLPGRNARVCPPDYNRCPFDGAPCVLIEPKGESSRNTEVRCMYLGRT
ncbi:hypothetical protein LX32DRAFT_649851 [Colletotrichum zoysiae]|uniref:Uncharacterized protein n=1 Tax=Colletotrichum zoysiae TaxID=1216348 RepID=A0AAD9HP54_9PEZI|nr:hypothetical protein LX32DRAFT_649851 [Colletotrichum zoysiae]